MTKPDNKKELFISNRPRYPAWALRGHSLNNSGYFLLIVDINLTRDVHLTCSTQTERDFEANAVSQQTELWS